MPRRIYECEAGVNNSAVMGIGRELTELKSVSERTMPRRIYECEAGVNNSAVMGIGRELTELKSVSERTMLTELKLGGEVRWTKSKTTH